MNRKLGLIFLGAVIFSFLFGFFIANNLKGSIFDNQKDELLEEITKVLDEFYLYDISDDEKKEAYVASMRAIIDSYALANNDPYTRLAAVPTDSFISSDESFVGIGISLTFEKEGLRVFDIYKNSPAEGIIFPNDLIIGIKLENTITYFEDMSEVSITDLLNGDVGDTKNLIVKTPDGTINEVLITYQRIETPSITTLDLNNDNLGYIKISSFNSDGVGTHLQFKNALATIETRFLKTEENQTLIIDLRDNPGGSLNALHNGDDKSLEPGIVQQLLVRDSTPAFTMTDHSQLRRYFGGLSAKKTYNIVGLVNNNSASASEVLAAALKYHGNYNIYGTNTYGKGVFQSYYPLVTIGTMDYYLVFTHGTWDYANNLNVSTTPIEVNEILQTGIMSLEMPVYHGVLEYDDVSLSLGLYQEFLNYLYKDELNLRTDGYFDIATRNLVEKFQNDYGLIVTGKLDLLTARRIDSIYRERIASYGYDDQLNKLIEILN